MTAFARAFRTEATTALRDPGALLVLVGAIVLYAFFYPIPYLPEVLKGVPVVVVDLDHSPLSRRLTQMVGTHELLALAAQVADQAAAERLVAAGEAGGILVIPREFERGVRRGDRVTVAAYADASSFLVYRQALTGLLESVGTMSAGIEIRRLEARGMSEAQARAAREPLPLQFRPQFNAAEGYASYIVPSVLVLILQQTLLIGVGVLAGTARERRTAGLAALPAPPPAIVATLLGRAAFYVALYSLHAWFSFAVVTRIFAFPQHARPGVAALFAVPFLLAAVFLALALANAFTRRESAIATLVFTSLPALFLAGFSWPPEAIPAWLRFAAALIPSTAGMAGFLRVNQMGASLAEVRGEWVTLWVLAAVYFLVAWACEHRRAAQATAPGDAA